MSARSRLAEKVHPVFGFVGYAMCFCWFSSFFYYTRSPFFSFGFSEVNSWAVRAAAAAVFVVLFSLSGAVADFFSTPDRLGTLWLLTVVLVAGGYLAPIVVARAVLLAAGYVCLLSLWDVYLTVQPKVLGFAGQAVAASGALGLVVLLIPVGAADIMLAILPLGSLVLLALVAPSTLAQRKFVLKADSSVKPYRSFDEASSLLSTGFLLGIAAACISHPSQVFPRMGYTGAAMTFLFAGVLLIVDALRTRYYSQTVLLKFSLLGVAPSLLVIPFLPSEWLSVGGWLLLFIMLRHGTFAVGDVAEKVRTLKLSDFASFSTMVN